MRIISGAKKGIKLRRVKGSFTRSTSEKVREALFNMLSGEIQGAKFVDFFSGTGAVGIEAVSRGASSLYFVENNLHAFKVLKENTAKLLLQENQEVKIIKGDALKVIEKLKGIKFNIVFMDPPYASDTGMKLLAKISGMDIVEDKGKIIVEHHHKTQYPEASGKFKKVRTEKYGETVLSFYLAC